MHSVEQSFRRMGVLGLALCFDDPDQSSEAGIAVSGIDASILPPMVRRRTSMATKMAVTALDQACADAGVANNLPVIFTSVVGEMAVTDKLCEAIADSSFPLSPTLFHNSVHNTAAGYWSMAVKSMAPMQSMAGLEDSFAMGLLEAYCQLDNGAEQVVVVSYDESMPTRLLPNYQWKPCAIALVLGKETKAKVTLSRPYVAESRADIHGADFSSTNPALAGLALLKQIISGGSQAISIPVSAGESVWSVDLQRHHD